MTWSACVEVEFIATLKVRAASLVERHIALDMREAIRLAAIELSNAIEREAAEAQGRLTAARVAAIDGLGAERVREPEVVRIDGIELLPPPKDGETAGVGYADGSYTRYVGRGGKWVKE